MDPQIVWDAQEECRNQQETVSTTLQQSYANTPTPSPTSPITAKQDNQDSND